MATKKPNRPTDPDILDSEIYATTWLRSIRFIFILIFLGISTFFIFWNPINNFQGSINQFIQKSVGCPITIESTKFGFFLPRIELHSINLPNGCFSPTQKEILLNSINLYFVGFSLSPLGPVLKLQLNYQNFILPTRLTIGLKEMAFSIQEELPLLPLSQLVKDITGFDFKLAGKLDLDMRSVFKNQQLDLMLIKAKGKEVILEKSTIYGLVLPNINLQDLSIHAEGKNNKIALQKFILGKKDKDLFLDSKGNIKLASPNNPDQSQSIDLKVNLTLGEKLLKEFSIIDMVLGNFKGNTAGSYQFSLKGDLNAPQLSK